MPPAGVLWAAGAAAMTLLPGAVGAILLVRWGLGSSRRAGVWLWSAAVAWSLLGALHGPAEALRASQVLAVPWLFAAGAALAAPARHRRRTVAGAVVAGLALMAAVSVAQALGWTVAQPAWFPAPLLGPGAPTAAVGPGGPVRAMGWSVHPNLWAAAVLVPGLFVLSAPGMPRWRWWALIPVSLVVTLAGSRAAVVGLGLGLLTLLATNLAAGRVRRRTALGIGTLLLVALALGSLTPLGARFGALFALVGGGPTGGTTVNLIRDSEDLTSAAWTDAGVDVRRHAAESGPEAAASWTVRKLGSGSGRRVMQAVVLDPRVVYTLSAELLTTLREGMPGLLGWAAHDGGPPDVLAARRTPGGWHFEAGGALTLVRHSVETLGDGWVRVVVTFRNASDAPVRLPIGVTPNQAAAAGGEVEARALQLEVGARATPYAPTTAATRISQQAQGSAQRRLPVFAAAWQGFLQAPWLGHGSASFTAFFRHSGDGARADIAHAHNMILQALYAYGAPGALVLVALLVGLLVAAPAMLPAVLAVVAANMFDYTLWSAHVVYPLALASGLLWRRASHGHGAAADSGAARP